MRLLWLPRAARELGLAHGHIAADNPVAAQALLDRLAGAIDRLADRPLMGRPGRVQGTRELFVPRTKYIVVYQVDEAEDCLEILAVMHTSRRRPKSF